MYFKFFSYLKFLLKSTNQHGVHSPFVFDYMTRCLYTKPNLSNNKAENILLKSIVYFDTGRMAIVENPSLKQKIIKRFPNLRWDTTPSDILFFDHLDLDGFKKLFGQGYFHNDSILILNGIHQSLENRKNWRQLIDLKEITVSIDVFHCGLLFLRKEQVKEHFTIRI